MRFKKVLSVAAAVCFCGSVFGGKIVRAAADHDRDDVKISYSFDSALEFSTSCAKLTDTGDSRHNNAMEIFPIENTVSASKKFPDLEKGVKTTVSFDFYAKQTDHIFRMAFHDGTKVYNSIYWDHAGRVLFSLNGAEPTGITKTNTYSQQQAIIPYDAGSWHNVSMVINPAGKNTVIDYFYDGAKIGTCETSRSETGNLDSIYLTSTISGYGIANTEKLDYDGSEGLCIDNLKISQGDADFYASAEDTEDFVRIEFSEQISNQNSLEEITLINTVTGEEAGVSEIIDESGNLYIVLEAGLEMGKEYIVKIPDGFVSVSGKTLYGNMIYFTSNHGTSGGSWEAAAPYVFRADFENLPLGSAIRNDEEWNTVIAASTINGVSCEETDGNKFVRFTNEGGATYLRFESSGKWTDDAVYDRVIAEMDISLPEIKRSSDILLLINSKTVGQCFFDSYGRFVAVSGGGFDSAEDTDGEYPENHIVYDFSQEADKRYRLSCRIDKAQGTIDYYIDNEFAGRTQWDEKIENPKLSAIRIKANSELNDGRAIDFDNFLIAHPKSSDTVSKMRLFARNGESWGAYAQDVIPTVSEGRLEFSCNIDPESVQAENIVISDDFDTVPITVTERESNSVTFSTDEFLKADTDYTISVSGICSASGIVLSDYAADFRTISRKSVDIEDFRLENSAGSRIINISDISEGMEIFLKAEIINSTDTDIVVRPILAEVADNILAQTAEEKISVPSGRAESVSLKMIVQNEKNAAISAMLTDADYIPMCQAIEYSNMSEPIEDEWTVVYRGKLKSEKSGEQVFVDILLPGKTRNDINSAAALSTVLAYRAQTVTGTDGEFNIKFRLEDNPEIDGDAVSGQYSVLLSCAGEIIQDKISFANAKDTAKLIAQINTAAEGNRDSAVGMIKDIIANNPDALGINDTDFAKIDSRKFADMVYNFIKKNGPLVDTVGAKKLFGKCMIISLTDGGEIKNLFDYSSELELSESKIKNLYTMSFVTEALQKEITSELRGCEFASPEEFYSELTEKFVLNAVEHPDGTNNVRTVIKELCSDIPIDAKKAADAPDSVYIKLAHNKYQSYSKLAEAFNNAYRNATEPSNNGGGSGGGGGGNSGGGRGSSSVSMQTIINETSALLPDKITPIPLSIFDDIDNVAWAKEAIISLAEKKIISGKGENKFCPDDNITREEFTKMVVNAFLKDASAVDIRFEDVDENGWSFSFVAKAYGAKVISGYSDTYFGAKDNITRQDMATILYRAAMWNGILFENSIDKRFMDEENIPEYAREAVNILYNSNVISGVSEAEFDGASFATRAQAAKMIDGLLKL